MPAIFLPGPFADEDMLGAILGPAAAGLARAPASLAGHALFFDPHGARIALAAVADARASGVVVEAGPVAAARLAFAFAAFGAAPRPAVVRTAEGRAVDAYLAPAAQAAARRLDKPCDPEWRAHLAEAALEAMDHFGQRSAEAMPGLMQGVSYRALARVRGAAEPASAGARPGFSADDVAAAAVARPYAKYFAVEEHRLRHRRFDGRMSGIVERAVFASGDAVTIVPFDPRRGRVLLIEQFRIGPFARRDPRPWRLEPVAGRCDAGEGPETTARREAREEAGIELGRIERIAGYYTSPGMMSEHITAYVGEADLGGAGGVHGVAAEDEDIRVVVLPLAEALYLAASGEVNNGPLLVSLLWLGGQAGRLTAAWT